MANIGALAAGSAAVSGVLLSQVARTAARQLRAAELKVITVTGGVAVGKSTFARRLRRALIRQHAQRVEIVSTDGFLRSDEELEGAGLLQRKGFPESYDHAALAAFFAALHEPRAQVVAPLYCHRARGRVGQRELVRPDWLIIEGVYAQQPARASGLPSCAIFLEAEQALIEHWYTQRFLRLHGHRFSDTGQALRRAAQLYADVNYLNYVTCIAALRSTADLVLHKTVTHEFCWAQAPSGPARRAHSARHTAELGQRQVASFVAEPSTTAAFG